MARELRFSYGYASLAAVTPGGGWYPVRKELLALLRRYYGLDFYHLSKSSRAIGAGARGAYWLTFLGQPLLGQLGGADRLRQQLSFPEVSLQPMEDNRLLISLSEWPEALDTTLVQYVPQYHELACLLEPYLPDETMGWTVTDKAPCTTGCDGSVGCRGMVSSTSPRRGSAHGGSAWSSSRKSTSATCRNSSPEASSPPQ